MSNYYDICHAVYDKVKAVVPNTVLRKKLQVLDKVDTFPLCIVAPGERGEKLRLQTMNKDMTWNYPVCVCMVGASNRQVELSSTWMQTREDLRNALYAMANLPSSTFDVFVNPDEVVKFADYLGTNFDVTGFTFTYSACEQRVS